MGHGDAHSAGAVRARGGAGGGVGAPAAPLHLLADSMACPSRTVCVRPPSYGLVRFCVYNFLLATYPRFAWMLPQRPDKLYITPGHNRLYVYYFFLNCLCI